MDIARPDIEKKKRLRRRIGLYGGIACAAIFAVFILTMGRPLRKVDADDIWVGKVERGTMIRSLRGTGRLVPENVRWISARAAGRVEQRFVLSGAIVVPGTPILKLSNPELEQKLANAKLDLEAAQAELEGAMVRLQGELLALKSSVEALREETELSGLDARIQSELFADKLVSPLNCERARLHAEHSRIRLKMEEERLSFQDSSIEHQLASQKTRVDSAKANLELLQSQADALSVCAGFSGILQKLDLEPGMEVEQGAVIAQVADMTALKAVIEVQESQARDVTPGQTVLVDTRTSGEVQGRVARVDPNVENGIVKVDVHFTVSLPSGCRAEQTVQGTIELERLDDVVHVERPALVQPESSAPIFRIDPNGRTAKRLTVHFGRASVSQIEVRSGLKPGDKVILSDTTRWGNAEALEIK
jgi:HlyD family secretion protein